MEKLRKKDLAAKAEIRKRIEKLLKFNARIPQIIAELEIDMLTIQEGELPMPNGNNRPVMSFKMGKTEVTFDQWDACVASYGCKHKPDDEGWGRGTRPVVNINVDDINEQFIP